MVRPFDLIEICQSLKGFVCQNWNRAPAGKPGIALKVVFMHWLFNHHYSLIMQPVNEVDGLFAICPALIGIDIEGDISDGTDAAEAARSNPYRFAP